MHWTGKDRLCCSLVQSVRSQESYSVVKCNKLCVALLTGTLKDHDAHRLQRASELPAENHRIHGTHLPHQQSLLSVQLHRAHAGQTHTHTQLFYTSTFRHVNKWSPINKSVLSVLFIAVVTDSSVAK